MSPLKGNQSLFTKNSVIASTSDTTNRNDKDSLWLFSGGEPSSSLTPTETPFKEVKLKEITLVGVDLRGVHVERARLERVYVEEAHLREVYHDEMRPSSSNNPF